MKNQINIGLCGLGTVGSGVFELLVENEKLIKDRLDAQLKVTRIATIDPFDHLDLDFSKVTITDSVDDVLSDPEIDIVVELIGGMSVAKAVVLGALNGGKSVVTANKALLAECSEEIFTAAYSSKGGFGYEAAVAGGIPIIRSMRQGFSGDRVDEISGIVNGTANYILSSMTEKDVGFDVALREAQEKGYAEADPTLDIGGGDAAHKLLLLMQLAYHQIFNFDDLYTEGITDIDQTDIAIAGELGYVIKLLAMTRKNTGGIEGRVHPALVSKRSVLASVNGAFNAVSVVGNFVGHTMSYGAGAGSKPTASAVVSDVIEVSRSIRNNQSGFLKPLVVPVEKMEKGEIVSINETVSEYFLRIGVVAGNPEMGDIASRLSARGVEIKSLRLISPETDNSEESVVVVLTNPAVESDILDAVESIGELSSTIGEIKKIRVYSEK